jgi:hypothetical protein
VSTRSFKYRIIHVRGISGVNDTLWCCNVSVFYSVSLTPLWCCNASVFYSVSLTPLWCCNVSVFYSVSLTLLWCCNVSVFYSVSLTPLWCCNVSVFYSVSLTPLRCLTLTKIVLVEWIMNGDSWHFKYLFWTNRSVYWFSNHVFTYIFIKLNRITLKDCLIASVLHVKIVFQYV